MQQTNQVRRDCCQNRDSWSGRVTRAEIDLDAARHNITTLKRHIGDDVRMMAVVKANAYGHGAVPFAQTALECGASYLAVACADEGVQLRRGGISAPVLVMGYSQPAEMKRIAEYNLTPTINDTAQAQALSEAARTLGVKTTVHLKVDSGMNRYGSDAGELVKLAQAISRMRPLDMEGLFTHFARSDESDKSWTDQQFERYCIAKDELRKAGFEFRLYHCANSAAVMELPKTHMNMVRTGTALYGLYPSREVSKDIKLRPVMSLKSRVGRVHALKPGDGVSYGYTFVAKENARVALIPVGYGDGYKRSLSNIAPVLIHGHRVQVAGRVCMDQTVLNVSDVDDVCVGDEVVLIGRQGDQEIPVEELADLTGTINYEVCTWLSARVPRLYFSSGKCVGYSDLTTDYSLWS
jgi:alanine racemase